MKISILCFDLASNAASRAFLLAKLLEPLADVEVVGPQYGPAVWDPIASEDIAWRTVPGRKFPRFAASLSTLLAMSDGDLVYACKPRLTSAGIGYLARLRTRRPLLLDIDDWEVGFFLRSGKIRALGRALNFANPTGLPWTWLMERLRRIADGTTVASRFLERRFGGTLVPHVRDTEAWKPGCADAGEARRRLNVPNGRLVMFLGTPRGYKGVDDLCGAVTGLNRQDVAVALVGRIRRATPVARSRRAIPTCGFSAASRFSTCLAISRPPTWSRCRSRSTSDTHGQTPAKLSTRWTGRPIVSTQVSMIPEILDGCGVVVPPGDVRALGPAIGYLLDHPDEAAALGRKARDRCVAEYSFTAARSALFPLVERVMSRRTA